MTGVRVVLFDLGNVLVRFTPDSFWQTLGLNTPNERAPFVSNVRTLSTLYEGGGISTADFFGRVCAVFGKEFLKHQLEEAFASVLTTPVPGMEEIVISVQTRARAALVSNTNPFHWDFCRTTIPAVNRLPVHYLSFEIGAMKPDPQFYEHVIAGESLPADQLLFIDDVQENVAGAERAGMQTHLFETVERLNDALKAVALKR